jgi:hypothetical protein
VPIPAITDSGDLPLGVHVASLHEVLERFGGGGAQRRAVAFRLARIHEVACTTGCVARFILFGSFITDAADPNDVDVFLLMEDSFDAGRLTGETRLLFDHSAAQSHFGASVFWLRRLAAWEGEEAAVEYWQVTRGGGRRGIVEIVQEER